MKAIFICDHCRKEYDESKLATMCEIRCRAFTKVSVELMELVNFDMKENPYCYKNTEELESLLKAYTIDLEYEIRFHHERQLQEKKY